MLSPALSPGKSDGPSGERIIGWIEKACYIPEGKLLGQQVRLIDFQKECIRDIYDNPAGTRRAIISMGRKNSKTATSAFLLLNHLCGPSGGQRPNSQLFSTAQSREQAAVIFQLAAKIVRMSPILQGSVLIRDTAKELFCPALGNRYRALSKDATTAYGLNPSFVVHDELGQVRGPRSELYEAMETATGAQESPLSLIISTQAPTDADLLSILIDDAKAGNDPRVVIKLYTAPPGADPFAVETIRIANPAFEHFLNKTEVTAMAEDARRMPSREAEFRNLVLNQRVDTANRFISDGIWKLCGAEVQPIPHGAAVYAGLDLASVSDLCALVLIAKVGRVWQVHPTFWLPEEGLREKAKEDRVPYDVWARHDPPYLLTTPGSSVSYEYVAEYLRGLFDRYNIQKLAFDKWNMKHLRPWLVRAGFSEQMIEERFAEFSQGAQVMSPALRDMEQAIREKEIAHGNHPVMTMCAVNAVIEGKDDSLRRLSKNRSTGRIDGLVALAMAIGAAPLQPKAIDIRSMIG